MAVRSASYNSVSCAIFASASLRRTCSHNLITSDDHGRPHLTYITMVLIIATSVMPYHGPHTYIMPHQRTPAPVNASARRPVCLFALWMQRARPAAAVPYDDAAFNYNTTPGRKRQQSEHVPVCQEHPWLLQVDRHWHSMVCDSLFVQKDSLGKLCKQEAMPAVIAACNCACSSSFCVLIVWLYDSHACVHQNHIDPTLNNRATRVTWLACCAPTTSISFA